MFKLWTQTKYEEHEWETEVIKSKILVNWYLTKSDYDHRCLANFENKFNVYQ